MLNHKCNELKTSTPPAASTSVVGLMPPHEAIKLFPETRYYGSKKRLLNWLYDCLRPLKFETVLDAFGGTASVSLLFQAMRKSVTYHDALSSNTDCARYLLSTASTFDVADLDLFLEAVVPRRATIAEYFNGLYFTSDENLWLDGFMHQLQISGLSDQHKFALRYLLYQACLRKRPFNLFHRANLKLRTSTGVDRSFGNLTTWNKSFSVHMKDVLESVERNTGYFRAYATVLPSQNVENLNGGYDLVYLDPPYVNSQERYNYDSYWRKYHFLEGLSNYEDWEKKIDLKSRTRLLPEPEHFVSWSRRRSFQDKLFSLIAKHSKSKVVLSYVTDAEPTEECIRNFFEATFNKVTVHSAPHSHALSKSKKRELLFIGQP